VSTSELLVRQFDLVWSLAELHLDALVEADFLWAPAELTWTVHRGDDGAWRPDFAELEPDPIPVPTIAWLTWHIDWWWSAALDRAEGRTPPDRAAVLWPGTGAAALTRIRELAVEWSALLTDLDESPPNTLAHLASWVNIELTKNIAEVGQLRLLRAATSAV
jgi:hypothetical protein